MYHVNKYIDILLTEKKIYNIEQTINDDDDGNESIFTVKYNEQWLKKKKKRKKQWNQDIIIDYCINIDND